MSSSFSTIIDTVTSGTVVRVMGKTESDWSFIDHGGKTGFVKSPYLA